MKMCDDDSKDFVTVVSIGSLEKLDEDYVTVLSIGTISPLNGEESIEEVLVYRLPGERLGFGLKFEGGTKSNEFVKRLFIQSCAPDSPASMARCSWGRLVEGDEILQIDTDYVSSMTRIDCVRCLKDSNVVIKLVIKHLNKKEDSPLVVSAEKKRLPPPPPPPPVPPRRISKKLTKKPENQEPTQELLRNKPEFLPPDASFYLDLVSQEPGYYLSESDDTESSVSTVIDRIASLPNTTTSSFAGSLPSTPTAVQKQLNLTADNFFATKIPNEEEQLLEYQYFSDAQLSYGNEKMDCIVDEVKDKDENGNIQSFAQDETNLPRLLYAVPKFKNTIEKVQKFLENEIEFSAVDVEFCDYYNWQLTPQLPTIGEDDEEEGSGNENKLDAVESSCEDTEERDIPDSPEKFSPTNNWKNDQNPSTIREKIEIFSNCKSKNYSDKSPKGDEHWSLLAEQRQKNLSKLKGLVIPEQMTEIVTEFIDLPEIQSQDLSVILNDIKVTEIGNGFSSHQTQSSCRCSVYSSKLWDLPGSIIPKYSPAFKRKDLQVYENNSRSDCDSESINESFIDAPRSLESITSPAQSDCSFEYSNSSETKRKLFNKRNGKSSIQSEEESDDSAVSSSQSSFASKEPSPPASPKGFSSRRDTENRFLKADSIDAINRKNILASAKCRSGQDLRISSLLIERKTPEEKQAKETKNKASETAKDSPRKNSTVADLRESFEKILPAQIEVVKSEQKVGKFRLQKQVMQNGSSFGIPQTIENGVVLVTLEPEIPGGSVGITLAGGADYESKEVRIHKIRSGSSAHQDGRLQKGDKVLSINGKNVNGLIHAELVSALKEPLPRVTLEIIKCKESKVSETTVVKKDAIVENSQPKSEKVLDKGSIYTINVRKDSSGLGFSLDGGQDSPMGNMPLVIKKVFKGGAAEKSGNLHVGDHLLKINEVNVTCVTRFEAWSVLKKLPEGDVIFLTIKRFKLP